MVLIDGIPEPRLTVESFAVTGPLDIRSTRVFADIPGDTPGVLARWLCSRVVIAWPVRLVDDETIWPVLMQGELKRVVSSTAVGEQGLWFDLVDTWGDTTAGPVETIWWQNPDGSLLAQPYGLLSIGSGGNRSVGTFDVGGTPVRVIQAGSGLAWSVADALETVSVFAGLNLSLRGLPREVANAELLKEIDLTKPIAAALTGILEPYGLVIQRDLMRQGVAVVERRAVRPIGQGRPIRAAWAHNGQPLGDALKITADRPAQAAQLWVARAGGWLVESTFDLVGGWDPALQGQPDSDYDKGASTDFATYANVYRRWVLNEDGFFTNPPYNRGPAFDLLSFFGLDPIDPQPLVFRSNVTLQDDGTPLKPVVEMSTDSGSNWSVFPNTALILDSRAGVYLDPTKLPAAFLTAAKAGLARVRVTAGLMSPHRIELTRWRGNPFTGKLPPRVFDLADVFRFQRVDPQSIHSPDIAAGNTQADEVDQTQQMFRWLVQRMDRFERGGEPSDGRATLQLAGVWPTLRIGDRLLDARGPGTAADGQAQALARRGAYVRAYESLLAPRNRKGQTTTIDLTF
jgi:hypothetical protein